MIPVVSICIPVFSDFHFIDACLKSIEANTPEPYEIRVTDNGTGYPIESEHLQYLRRNKENAGYAAGTNQAAKNAKAPLLCLLNDDVEVQADWLPPLLAALEDPEVAVAGPRIIHPDGSLQTSGLKLWHGNGNAGGEELKDDGPTRDVDGVTAACMLIRRDVYHAMGGLCEDYWAGYEDCDLCMAVAQAGHRLRYIAESTVVHTEHGSGAARWVKVYDNIALMNQRWGNR